MRSRSDLLHVCAFPICVNGASLAISDLRPISSVKGATRAERCTWSEILRKWIDAHETELGIGRPYLDKDPPHVGPIEGREYADKHSAAKARPAGLKKPSSSVSTAVRKN